MTTTLIYDFNANLQFYIKLTPEHPLQKHCDTPKGFYQQGKFIVFIGNWKTGSSVRIKVPAKDVLEINIANRLFIQNGFRKAN